MPSPETPPVPTPRAIRMLLAGVGVLLVGVGALGVWVPGLPTTIFLIGASWCFARSCPWLEEKLLDNRLFRPYRACLHGTGPMPAKVRVVILISMWSAIGVSMLALRAAGGLSTLGAAAFLVAGAIGTWAVLRFRRASAFATAAVPDSPGA